MNRRGFLRSLLLAPIAAPAAIAAAKESARTVDYSVSWGRSIPFERVIRHPVRGVSITRVDGDPVRIRAPRFNNAVNWGFYHGQECEQPDVENYSDDDDDIDRMIVGFV